MDVSVSLSPTKRQDDGPSRGAARGGARDSAGCYGGSQSDRSALRFFSSFLISRSALEDEELLLSIPNVGRAFEHLAFYTGRPHVAGTIEDYDTAVYTRDAFLRYGIDAEIVEHKVLLNYPKERHVRLIAPTQFAPLVHNLHLTLFYFLPDSGSRLLCKKRMCLRTPSRPTRDRL